MNQLKRNNTIDISKGIALLLVILGHLKWDENLIFFFKNNTYYNFIKFIYSFHIVIFFIFVGYFYSIKKNNKEYNFFIFKKFILKYIIFVLIYFFNTLFCNWIESIFEIAPRNTNLSFYNLIYAIIFSNSHHLNKAGIHGFLWFMPAYCLSALLFIYTSRIKNKITFIFFLAIISPLIGYYATLFLSPQNVPWGLNIALVVAPFTLVGLYYKKIEKIIFHTVHKYSLWSYIFILIIFIILISNKNYYGLFDFIIPNIFMFYFYGVLGFIFITFLAVFLLEKPLGNVFALIGRNSLIIYLCHIMIIDYAWLFHKFYFQSYVSLILSQMLIVALSIVLPSCLVNIKKRFL